MEKEADSIVSLRSETVLATEFCAVLREELDDYREAINQNMDELGSCFDYAQALDRKIDRLAERIDELALLIAPQSFRAKQPDPLSEREKSVFLALYSLVDVHPWVSFQDLAKKLNVSGSQLSSQIAALVQKGIPILKRYSGGFAYVGIEPAFKEQQAKTNFLKLTTPLSCWLR